MEKISLNPTARLVVEIAGKEYPVTRPKMGAIRVLEERLKAANQANDGVLGIIFDHLVSCGLPAEVVDELDGHQLDALTEFLNRPKKK